MPFYETIKLDDKVCEITAHASQFHELHCRLTAVSQITPLCLIRLVSALGW